MALYNSLKTSQIGSCLSIPHLEKEIGCGHKGNDHHLQTQPQVVGGAFWIADPSSKTQALGNKRREWAKPQVISAIMAK